MTLRRLFLSLLASIAAHTLILSMIGTVQIAAREKKEDVIMVELTEEQAEAVPIKASISAVGLHPVPLKPSTPNSSDRALRSKKLASYRLYLLKVKARVEHFWNFPPGALQGRPEAVTTIRFVIGNSGSLLNRVVESSSGSDHLDRIALEAVQQAAPFERIPAVLNLPQLQVVARFKYTDQD